MSIRIKLLLTYAILLIISASVLFFSGMAMIAGFFRETSRTILQDNHLGEVVVEVVDLLAELKQAEDYDPQRLVDPDFIENLNERIQFLSGGLIVRYNKAILDYSSLPKEPTFYDQLVVLHSDPDVDYETMKEEHVAIQYQDKEYIYFDYAFQYDDQDVLYFFVADVTRFGELEEKSGRHFFLGLLVILILIMSPLLWIITSDIIKPLKTLEYGVNNIKEGNLDFKLETRKRNEIGRVIQYFDRMRQELKASIDKQIRYENSRKELISSISHDLKTPIASIKGHVEGIQDGVANTPEKLEKYVNVIHQKSMDMDQLIDDLFLFSKFDLDRVPFNMQEVQIGPFITNAVQEMRLEWENENRKINLILRDKELHKIKVKMDQQHMKRVFVNLIQNSVKYMDKTEGKIDVILNLNDDFVQIVISDNGMGIDEAHLEHIFDRFYRVDESRNIDTGGTGLGLAITKQIVEQHGGFIYASSKLGEGTKMIVELKRIYEDSNEEKARLDLES